MNRTATKAADIRKQLKTLWGYGTRHVSVRSDSYSMGSSIVVRVLDASVDFKKVKEIAEGKESIRRCEASGEILSGGNCYVSVTWDDKALDQAAQTLGVALGATTTDGWRIENDGRYFLAYRRRPEDEGKECYCPETLRAWDLRALTAEILGARR